MGRASQAKVTRKIQHVTLLRNIEAIASPILARHFSALHPVNGTRVMIEVLSRLGINANPMACRLVVMNSIYWAHVRDHGAPQGNELQELADRGAWSLGRNGEPVLSDPWPWHLVCVAKGHIIDSALGLYARPEKQVHVPHIFVAPIDQEWIHGGMALFENHRNTVVMYQAMPLETGFTALGGFAYSKWNLDAANDLYRALGKFVGRQDG